MATTTEKLGLTKPDLEDNVSIEKFNENFDKIDALGDLIPLKEQVNKLEFVILKLEPDKWSSSAPYTQTMNIPGMTADWIPGVPTFIPFTNSDGSVKVSDTANALEHVAYIKILVSGNGTLTAICPENKPTYVIWLRVPGQIER